MARELLTITEIQKALPKEKEYLMNDGANLYLKVLPSGTKSFFFISHKTEQGKKIVVKKALGKFPIITLEQARQKAQKEREKLAGISINEVKSTFKERFLEYFEIKKARIQPTTIASMESCYNNYYSKMAQIKLYKLTRKDILKAFDQLIKEDKKGMFKMALGFLKGFLDYAVQFEWISSNPAKEIDPKIIFQGKKAVKHHAYLKDIQSVIKLKEKILNANEYPDKQQALIVILYTATRANETLGAKWCEFDLEKGLWTIPANRMKTKKEFIIPLSTQLLAFFKELYKMAKNNNELIFKNGKGGKINAVLIRRLIFRLGYDKNTLTTHGLRGTLASIANDLRAEHGLSNDIIQASLSHEAQNAVAKAYNHSIYLEERKRLLQWWGDKLGEII